MSARDEIAKGFCRGVETKGAGGEDTFICERPCAICLQAADWAQSALAAAGYKILSREPTKEMTVASPVSLDLAADVWESMFDAASPLPTPDPEKQT